MIGIFRVSRCVSWICQEHIITGLSRDVSKPFWRSRHAYHLFCVIKTACYYRGYSRGVKYYWACPLRSPGSLQSPCLIFDLVQVVQVWYTDQLFRNWKVRVRLSQSACGSANFKTAATECLKSASEAVTLTVLGYVSGPCIYTI